MPMWNRRSVLATSVALAVASGIASNGVGAFDADDEGTAADRPDPSLEPNPDLDEQWLSADGGAGNARSVPNDPEFDGEALEPAWSVDIDHVGSVAVTDETIYATNESAVVALEAADGSVVWEADDVGHASEPAVDGDSVYVSGEHGEIVALDRADGSIRWSSDVDPEDRNAVSRHTVAYGAVFVVVEGTLYALEADDGSVRWQLDAVEDEDGETDEFRSDVAAANGVVYAVTEGFALALEPESGDERWRVEATTDWSDRPSRATATGVIVGGSYYGSPIRDAETGERIAAATSEYVELVLDDEMYVGGDAHAFYGRSYAADDEYEWKVDIHYSQVSAAIAGETVYAYVHEAEHPPSAAYSADLVALDKRDGTERWARSGDEVPVGPIRALSGDTLYVSHDDELVALRERSDDGESDGSDDGDANGDESADGSTESESANGDDADDATDGESTEGTGDETSTDELTDDESTDTETTDESPTDDVLGDEESSGSDEEGAESADETAAAEDADATPGLTTGAGIVGGALGLEWIRRKTSADEQTD
ncbi:outer membrane protein assembly factor BamB family protein [Natronolimnohabitans innermongolicus]|nr:PQQ-binding-like beta-propeller repeat protein [Natronolimnohabitans innermongolicus]